MRARRAPRLQDLPPRLREQIEKQLGASTELSKPTKYRSRSVEGPMGELYDSQWECDVAWDLEMQLRRGEIARWSWAPRFVLQWDPQRPRTLVTYRPDFIVWKSRGASDWYAIDAKGVRTQLFARSERMWRVKFPNNPLVVLKKPKRRAAA